MSPAFTLTGFVLTSLPVFESFMSRFGSSFSPTLKIRFVAHNRDYVDAVVKEATLRERGAILSENEYRNLRRDNGAMIILFDLIEVTLGIELPAEVHEDPNFKQIYLAALDLILFTNVSFLSRHFVTTLLIIIHRMCYRIKWSVRGV